MFNLNRAGVTVKVVQCRSWKNSLIWLGLLKADILDYTSNCFLVYFLILAVCFNFGSFTIWHWSSNRTPHVAVLQLLKALPISINFHFCQYNKQWIDHDETIMQNENQLCLAVIVRIWVTHHLDNKSHSDPCVTLIPKSGKTTRFLSLQLKIYSLASEVPAGTGGKTQVGLSREQWLLDLWGVNVRRERCVTRGQSICVLNMWLDMFMDPSRMFEVPGMKCWVQDYQVTWCSQKDWFLN